MIDPEDISIVLDDGTTLVASAQNVFCRWLWRTTQDFLEVTGRLHFRQTHKPGRTKKMSRARSNQAEHQALRELKMPLFCISHYKMRSLSCWLHFHGNLQSLLMSRMALGRNELRDKGFHSDIRSISRALHVFYEQSYTALVPSPDKVLAGYLHEDSRLVVSFLSFIENRWEMLTPARKIYVAEIANAVEVVLDHRQKTWAFELKDYATLFAQFATEAAHLDTSKTPSTRDLLTSKAGAIVTKSQLRHARNSMTRLPRAPSLAFLDLGETPRMPVIPSLGLNLRKDGRGK